MATVREKPPWPRSRPTYTLAMPPEAIRVWIAYRPMTSGALILHEAYHEGRHRLPVTPPPGTIVRAMALRIVAVDDSPTIRALMKDWLGGAGYEVTLCANGMEAVPIIKANPPYLVVSDVSMPHMDGFTLCRSLKEAGETAHVPVVMFTRLDDAREVLRG